MRDDDPFDSQFFHDQREELKEDAGLFRRVFGWGMAAAIVGFVLQLVVLGATVAVVLWVALTILQHFSVLMIAGGLL